MKYYDESMITADDPRPDAKRLRKIWKRLQAQVRQTAHDSLTLEEKLQKLDRLGHRAVKERNRLQQQISVALNRQAQESKAKKKSQKSKKTEKQQNEKTE